jgi:hypothetical protein
MRKRLAGLGPAACCVVSVCTGRQASVCCHGVQWLAVTGRTGSCKVSVRDANKCNESLAGQQFFFVPRSNIDLTDFLRNIYKHLIIKCFTNYLDKEGCYIVLLFSLIAHHFLHIN